MLRRNGTRSSCEPCRKAKVKCDHRSPFCQRCETRGISALCVYHPAPLTRSPAPEARRTHKLSKQQYQSGFRVLDLSGDGLSESAFPSTQVSFTAPGAAPPAATQIHTNTASNAIHSRPPSSFGGGDIQGPTTASSSDPSHEPTNAQSAPKAASSSYYGSTSYYSVFDRVDQVPTATTNSQHHGPGGDTFTVGIRDDDPGVSQSLQLGSWILQNLQHVSVVQSLVETYIRTSQVSPTATLIPLEAVETLQQLDSEDVHALAHKTTMNTQKPLQVPPEMPASTFSTLFTSDNLRWEFLGLVFAWAGLSLSMSMLNENGSATTPEGISKTAFAQLLTACSDACIILCRQNSHTNDILSWCLYENLILQTFQHGEASEH
jgi:hypothetical protein